MYGIFHYSILNLKFRLEGNGMLNFQISNHTERKIHHHSNKLMDAQDSVSVQKLLLVV